MSTIEQDDFSITIKPSNRKSLILYKYDNGDVEVILDQYNELQSLLLCKSDVEQIVNWLNTNK